jgi:hypothetical protein
MAIWKGSLKETHDRSATWRDATSYGVSSRVFLAATSIPIHCARSLLWRGLEMLEAAHYQDRDMIRLR